jgi:fructose-1,6-bisphosphatase/inositol monophosphatase family enzyme
MLKETLLKAAGEAGGIMQQYFNGNFKITSKLTINDLVTEVDKLSEEAISVLFASSIPITIS